MLNFILRLLRGGRGKAGRESETVRRWTEQEANRVRTFEERTEVTSSDGVAISINYTQELATSRQMEFLQKLGFSADGLSKGDASLLLDRILRPVSYALSQTFKQVHATLPKEHLRAMQIRMVHWGYYSKLPRFGPYSTWSELEASGNDPQRALSKEERMAVADIAFEVLPPEVFLSLKSNGIKKYKDALDHRLRTST